MGSRPVYLIIKGGVTMINRYDLRLYSSCYLYQQIHGKSTLSGYSSQKLYTNGHVWKRMTIFGDYYPVNFYKRTERKGNFLQLYPWIKCTIGKIEQNVDDDKHNCNNEQTAHQYWQIVLFETLHHQISDAFPVEDIFNKHGTSQQ